MFELLGRRKMTSSEVGARIARRNVRERAADANQRALALPASPVAGTSETLGANSPEGGLTPSPGAPSRPAGGGPSGGGGAVVPITFNHFRRRDYDKYAVDVPKELPASAKRTKKFCDSATNTLWGALGIPKLDGEGSGSKLVEQTEGAMRLIRKRMIEHGTLRLPARQAERPLRGLLRLPAAERPLRGLHRLPAWQAEVPLRGLQALPARQAEGNCADCVGCPHGKWEDHFAACFCPCKATPCYLVYDFPK